MLEPALVEVDEALHAFALGHHHHQLQNLLLVLSKVLHSQEEEQFEVLEDVGVSALHQLHVILGQLEWRSLKIHVSRGTG